MAARTDAEKLAAIGRYCRQLVAMSGERPGPGMTPEEAAYFTAVGDGYNTAATHILNIIQHGTSRPPRTEGN